MTSMKQLVKGLFDACGLEIRKKKREEIPRASMRGALRQVSRLGFRPQTVIDVGVAQHTTDLYEEFKEASILLIEPLVEFEPSLRNLCSSYKAQYVLAAAGAAPGTAVLNVHHEQPDCSSFLKEAEGPTVDGCPREVAVVTIDQVCSERKLKGPYLIKVDVQGAELTVLEGAKRTLPQTEVVILEVTLFGTMIGGPQLYDVVSGMREHGFVVYDVCGFLYRPFDNALCQMDMMFVREQGPFRQIHVFATPEQREAMAWSPEAQLTERNKVQR